MRRVEHPELDGSEEQPDDVGCADWKDSPEHVLDVLDEQLKAFGLEILQYDTGADDYAWKIVRREP